VKDPHTHVALRAHEGQPDLRSPGVANARAVTKVNPIRPRYAKREWPACQRCVKPAPATKAAGSAVAGLPGVVGDGARGPMRQELERPGGAGMAAATGRGKP